MLLKRNWGGCKLQKLHSPLDSPKGGFGYILSEAAFGPISPFAQWASGSFPKILNLAMFQEATLKFRQKLLLWAWSGRGISSKSWAYRHKYKILNLIFLIAVLYHDSQNWNLALSKFL